MTSALTDRLMHVSLGMRRAATLAYWLVLTTGTHWPRFRPPFQSVFPVDKLLHVGAFGILTLLLIWCRPFQRLTVHHRSPDRANLLLSCLFAMALAAIDELTQEIAWVNRDATLNDWLADVGGVLLAVIITLWTARRKPG